MSADLSTVGLILGIVVSAGAVVGLLVKLVAWVAGKVAAQLAEAIDSQLEADRTERKLMAHGLQSLMRATLVQMHDRYTTLGWMSDTDKQSFEALYTDYEALGGNGIIAAYHEDVLRLPTTWRADGEEA